MEIEASLLIDRPAAEVWDFYAVHHVENHPRWDPDISLERTSDEPLGPGSVIRRRNTRFGTPTAGTMEITEFTPERRMAVITRDGDSVIHGFANFAADGPDRTRLTMGGEFQGIDDSMADKIRLLIERSLTNIKTMIEGTP